LTSEYCGQRIFNRLQPFTERLLTCEMSNAAISSTAALNRGALTYFGWAYPYKRIK